LQALQAHLVRHLFVLHLQALQAHLVRHLCVFGSCQAVPFELSLLDTFSYALSKVACVR